jgi:hypothetical protein
MIHMCGATCESGPRRWDHRIKCYAVTAWLLLAAATATGDRPLGCGSVVLLALSWPAEVQGNIGVISGSKRLSVRRWRP